MDQRRWRSGHVGRVRRVWSGRKRKLRTALASSRH